MIENIDASRGENLLPMGLSEDCVLKRDIAKDQQISYADVQIPEGRLCDKIRAEQDAHFFK